MANYWLEQAGQLGVSIFFALSGILITTRFLRAINDPNVESPLANFYLRRILKIAPVLLAYLSFLIVVNFLSPISLSKNQMIASLLFYRNYIEPDAFTTHLWSLAIEEQFYLFFPLLAFHFRKHFVHGLIFFSVIIFIWRFIEFKHEYFYETFRVHIPMAFRTDLRLDGILWGCALALMAKNRDWDRYLRRKILFYIFIIATLLFYFFHLQNPLLAYSSSVLIPLIIYWTAANNQFWLTQILELDIVRIVGRMSYSIYVWHFPFCFPNAFSSPTLRLLATFPINILSITVISILSYQFIEKPIQKLGKRQRGFH